MIYILAILWAAIGIVSAAVYFHRKGDDFTVGQVLISALLGLLVPASLFKWTEIVILKGRK